MNFTGNVVIAIFGLLVAFVAVPCIQAESILIDQSTSLAADAPLVSVLVGQTRSEVKPLLGKTKFCSCNYEGFLVIQRLDGGWILGTSADIEAGKQLKAPEKAEAAYVSHDGKRILWVVNEPETDKQPSRYRLLLSEPDNDVMQTLAVHEGTLRQPSWSPDNSAIAYYIGPKDYMTQDGFVLTMIKLAEPQPIELAPASRYSGIMHPERETSPSWSPDGKRILFTAGYDDPPKTSAAGYETAWIVDVETKTLTRARPGIWNLQGSAILTIIYESASQAPPDRSLGLFNLETSTVTNLGLKLPATVKMGAWSPSGRYFAFQDFDGSISFIELETKTTQRVHEKTGNCMLWWVQ